MQSRQDSGCISQHQGFHAGERGLEVEPLHDLSAQQSINQSIKTQFKLCQWPDEPQVTDTRFLMVDLCGDTQADCQLDATAADAAEQLRDRFHKGKRIVRQSLCWWLMWGSMAGSLQLLVAYAMLISKHNGGIIRSRIKTY